MRTRSFLSCFNCQSSKLYKKVCRYLTTSHPSLMTSSILNNGSFGTKFMDEVYGYSQHCNCCTLMIRILSAHPPHKVIVEYHVWILPHSLSLDLCTTKLFNKHHSKHFNIHTDFYTPGSDVTDSHSATLSWFWVLTMFNELDYRFV